MKRLLCLFFGHKDIRHIVPPGETHAFWRSYNLCSRCERVQVFGGKPQ